MRRKSTDFDELDDGETIVNMDVEGMPWHDQRSAWGLLGRRPLSHDDHHDASDSGSSSTPPAQGAREFTKEEVRAYRHAALKVSLIVAAVFAVVFGLFIAFLDFIVF